MSAVCLERKRMCYLSGVSWWMTRLCRICAKGRCLTARIWTCIRDDQPCQARTGVGTIYYATRGRRREHPLFPFAKITTGIAEMDCFYGFVGLGGP